MKPILKITREAAAHGKPNYQKPLEEYMQVGPRRVPRTKEMQENKNERLAMMLQGRAAAGH